MSKGSEYVARFRERRRAEGIALLGGRCIKCGTTQNLHFDHIDPQSKSFNLDRKGIQVRRDVWLKELAKCQLLCAYHHRLKTSAEQSADRLQPINHGTQWAYGGRGCRCEICRTEWARLRKKYR